LRPASRVIMSMLYSALNSDLYGTVNVNS